MTVMVAEHPPAIAADLETTGVSAFERGVAIEVLGRAMSASEARSTVERLFGAGRGMKSVEWLVATTLETAGKKGRLDDGELVPLLVDLAGPDLLADKGVRRQIAMTFTSSDFEVLEAAGIALRGNHVERARMVADRNWHPGKSWARNFAQVAGLPARFAGERSDPSPPSLEIVSPFVPLPPLADFQESLGDQLMAVLGEPAGARAILTLPTGAGKTRTTVETLLRWFLESRSVDRTILWIAQSEELCEQAVQSFQQVWFDLGYRRSVRERLHIGRFWASHQIEVGICDVVVASIQKLHAALDVSTDVGNGTMQLLGESLGVVVIDEAHLALAPSYTAVLRRLGVHAKDSRVPLIGLSATPRRSGEEETARLRKRFGGRLLHPAGVESDPVEYFRRQGVLSLVEHEILDYGATVRDLANDEEIANHVRQFGDIPTRVLGELAEARQRNLRILDRLLEMPESWPTLVFACTVQHAHALTALLARRNRSSACVTGDTKPSTRRSVIERFRRGEVSVLCNYGVLTTGFDAPRVRAVVVARPTKSQLLYEQMIGRGLRGPRFGGTEQCLVVDVADNLQWLGTALGASGGADLRSIETSMRSALD